MLRSSLARLELTSTVHTFLLTSREVGRLGSFPIPLSLRRTAPLPCKTPLLLLGIIGLVATLLEFEEGQVALPIKQLQNKNKHTLFHLGHRARDQCKSALHQVRVKRGSKLHPRNKTILCFLSGKDVGEQGSP